MSSDTTVATVDSGGLITAVSDGHARITVTASNGVSAYILLTVRETTKTLTGFELAWGNKWEIDTYTDSNGKGYYVYDWITANGTTTTTCEIGNSSEHMLLSPQVVYSNGFTQIILPESYKGYGFTFTSSDPSLVTINSDSTITLNRAIGSSESPKTVTITVYSSFFETSVTATLTIYHKG